MALIIDGEQFNHGLDSPEQAAQALAADPLAHEQNTDVGTSKTFFEVGRGSTSAGAGPVRRGFVFNPGGVGPFTAFAWEARDKDGKATGRFVECLNVLNGDPTNDGNVWQNFGFARIAAGAYGDNPEVLTARDGIADLYGRFSRLASAPPVIGGFNPGAGAVGAVVLINGNNFGTTTGSVQLNGVTCTVSSWSNTQITTRVPIGGTTGTFTVTTAGGSDISRDSFAVVPATVVTTPGPIANLVATPGNGSVVLTWDAPTDTGNATISDHEVRYRLSGGVFASYPHSPRNVSNMTVAGLTNNELYEFTVAPINSKGIGPASGVVSATPVGSATVYRATEQSYTTTPADLAAACGSGTLAQPVTAKSSDGISTTSQDAANTQAAARAKSLAIQGIICPMGPPAVSLADESVTNAKLAKDVKVGSLAAASNAYPQADRATVAASVEAFLVYIGGKLSDIYTRLQSLDKSVGDAATQALDFARRITALEVKGGTGGGGSADFPAQSAATTGWFLQSTGTAGAEKWANITNNRVGWVFGFENELTRDLYFFNETRIRIIKKSSGLSTLTYSIAGATAVNVVFVGNVFTANDASVIVIPADSVVTFTISYNTNFNKGSFRIEGAETV